MTQSRQLPPAVLTPNTTVGAIADRAKAPTLGIYYGVRKLTSDETRPGPLVAVLFVARYSSDNHNLANARNLLFLEPQFPGHEIGVYPVRVGTGPYFVRPDANQERRAVPCYYGEMDTDTGEITPFDPEDCADAPAAS